MTINCPANRDHKLELTKKLWNSNEVRFCQAMLLSPFPAAAACLTRGAPAPCQCRHAEGCRRPEAQGKARSPAQINPAACNNDYTPPGKWPQQLQQATFIEQQLPRPAPTPTPAPSPSAHWTRVVASRSLYKSKLCNLFTFCIKIVHWKCINVQSAQKKCASLTTAQL